MSIGSLWIDSKGQEFKITAIDHGTETWVAYTRLQDNTSYRCLAESFTDRFTRIENESR
jgi:hypothetical protein